MCPPALVPLAVPWQGGTAAILHPEHRERREPGVGALEANRPSES